MRFYELKPTDETLIQLMLEDSIGRNKDLMAFANIISSIEGSASIALDSAWGSGKTFFVKQLKILFDAFNPTAKGVTGDYREEIRGIWRKHREGQLLPQTVIYYDCWKNDNDNDPVLSLVYSIIQTEATEKDLTKYGVVFSKAIAVLDEISGKRISGLAEVLKGKDALKTLKEAKETQTLVKEFLDTFFTSPTDRMTIIIDELDRCNPDYAVKVLERIKHYFDDDRITFVFATNLCQLEYTIRKHYGNDFDSGRYLDRFFHMRLSLPKVDMDRYCGSLRIMGDSVYDNVCREVISFFNFEMREVSRYMQASGNISETITCADTSTGSRRERAWGFCAGYILPFMIGLKMVSIEKYERFVRGESEERFCEFIEESKYVFPSQLFSPIDHFENMSYREKEEKTRLKVELMYRYLFTANYGQGDMGLEMGNLHFQKDMTIKLKRIMSGLSEWSDYSDN